MSDTTREPVLWSLDFGGDPLHPDFVFSSAEAAENFQRHAQSKCPIVPLFRQPQATLTDAEREDLQRWIRVCSNSKRIYAEDGVPELSEEWGARACRMTLLLARLGGDA